MKSHNVSMAKLETGPWERPFLVLGSRPCSLKKTSIQMTGTQWCSATTERYVSYLMGHRKWPTFIAGMTQRTYTSDEFRWIFQDMWYIILPKYSFLLLIWRASLLNLLLRSLHSTVAKKRLHNPYHKILSCPIWSIVSFSYCWNILKRLIWIHVKWLLQTCEKVRKLKMLHHQSQK